MTKIAGNSDDYVTVDGKQGHWGQCDGDDIILEFRQAGAGVRIRMRYAELDGATWSATVEQLQEDIPIPWPVTIRADHEVHHHRGRSPGYSAVVLIDLPSGVEGQWRCGDEPAWREIR